MVHKYLFVEMYPMKEYETFLIAWHWRSFLLFQILKLEGNLYLQSV